MNGGPPTQSEIDYGCPLEQVRRRSRPRAPWFSLFLMCVVALVILCAWGLR